jgi:SNF2 family DNA or RNA helicase
MLQVCSGALKVNETHTAQLRTSKDDALGDILNGTDDPVVVFCTYRASVDRCKNIAKRAGKTVTVYDGRSKTETWKDFQSGKFNVLVCQYQAGAVGLNLQNSHIMVFFEPHMSALQFEQAQGRIYRKGQESKCIYYHLYTPGTIEEKVMRKVRSGVSVTNDMLQRWANGETF